MSACTSAIAFGVQSVEPESSSRMRWARCGGANSTPSGEAIPRAFAMTAKPCTGSAGVFAQPRQVWRASRAGAGRSRFAGSRSGTAPATRCSSPPLV